MGDLLYNWASSGLLDRDQRRFCITADWGK